LRAALSIVRHKNDEIAVEGKVLLLAGTSQGHHGRHQLNKTAQILESRASKEAIELAKDLSQTRMA
jgi:hypothetical protein